MEFISEIFYDLISASVPVPRPEVTRLHFYERYVTPPSECSSILLAHEKTIPGIGRGGAALKRRNDKKHVANICCLRLYMTDPPCFTTMSLISLTAFVVVMSPKSTQ